MFFCPLALTHASTNLVCKNPSLDPTRTAGRNRLGPERWPPMNASGSIHLSQLQRLRRPEDLAEDDRFADSVRIAQAKQKRLCRVGKSRCGSCSAGPVGSAAHRCGCHAGNCQCLSGRRERHRRHDKHRLRVKHSRGRWWRRWNIAYNHRRWSRGHGNRRHAPQSPRRPLDKRPRRANRHQRWGIRNWPRPDNWRHIGIRRQSHRFHELPSSFPLTIGKDARRRRLGRTVA